MIILAGPPQRALAHQRIDAAPQGWVVRITEPRKSRGQEERYHAMIADLAAQWTINGRKWDAESLKRLCVDQFRRDTAKDPVLGPLWDRMGTMDIAPSIDGSGLVALGWQTRRFPKPLASAFIEWLFALGAESDVVWTNEVRP